MRLLHNSEEFQGRPSGNVVSVGGVALTFRQRRSGARRGESPRYYPFTAEDRAKATLLAAAPRLFNALERLLKASEISESDCAYDQGEQDLANAEAHAAIAAALGTPVT